MMVDGKPVVALAQAGKIGWVYLLDNVFEFYGPVIFHHPSHSESARANATEVALDLNRGELLARRAERLRFVRKLLSIAQSQTDESFKAILFDEIRIKEVRREAEYAGMVRAFVNDAIAKGTFHRLHLHQLTPLGREPGGVKLRPHFLWPISAARGVAHPVAATASVELVDGLHEADALGGVRPEEQGALHLVRGRQVEEKDSAFLVPECRPVDRAQAMQRRLDQAAGVTPSRRSPPP